MRPVAIDDVATLAAAALPALVVWAAFADLLTRIIPNAVPVLLAAAFGAFALAARLDGQTLAGHIGSAALVLACGFKLFEVKAMGGGDAKLLAAVALWAGSPHLPDFLIVTALVGGALALGTFALRIAQGADNAVPLREHTIPYAVAIAASVLFLSPGWFAGF